MKYLFLTVLFSTHFFSNAQNCDCTSIPFKSGCEKECGLFYVLNGTEEQIQKVVKVDKSTASKITNLSNRKSLKTIQEFRNYLPEANFKDLELNYSNLISTILVQNNQNGNNFGGGQTVQTQINGNPFIYNNNVESVKFEIAKINRERRTKISSFCIEAESILNLIASDTLDFRLNNKINKWHDNTFYYLETIEPSFSTRFRLYQAEDGLSYDLKRPDNMNLFKYMKAKMKVLFNLINELKSDFYN